MATLTSRVFLASHFCTVSLAPVDGSPAVLRRRCDGSAGAARAASRGVSGRSARLLPAAQVPDPESSVHSADGQFPHCPRPHPGLPGPVSGVVIVKRHPGCS